MYKYKHVKGNSIIGVDIETLDLIGSKTWLYYDSHFVVPEDGIYVDQDNVEHEVKKNDLIITFYEGGPHRAAVVSNDTIREVVAAQIKKDEEDRLRVGCQSCVKAMDCCPELQTKKIG